MYSIFSVLTQGCVLGHNNNNKCRKVVQGMYEVPRDLVIQSGHRSGWVVDLEIKLVVCLYFGKRSEVVRAGMTSKIIQLCEQD